MANDQLDYLSLIKKSRRIDVSNITQTIRLAVLSDAATQQLIPLLAVLCAERGVKLDIYEAGYDAIDFEILNPISDLYKFDPQYIIILLSSHKLKSKLHSLQNPATIVDDTIDRLTNLWSALKQNCSATVIQSNFVTPSERAFGNYELRVEESTGSLFYQINDQLTKQIRHFNNVLMFDVDYLSAEVGRRRWFDERLWVMAKAYCDLNHLPLVAKSMIDIMLAAHGKFVKCVVLDLDNTLWGGVIGDDGINGIILGDFDEGESFVAFQHFIKDLKQRGIILAVVSKNEHANAILPFRDHPKMVLKEEDIAVFIANWDNKADNIRLVQQTLNIGFDSMVFLDDNPFERNIVRQYLPEVIVPELPDDPALYLKTIADLNLFETASFSATDRERGDQYREAAKRELTKSSFTNVSEYLTSLNMQIKLERFNNFNLPRIAQLIQRSNQFNLTTRRYGEAVCEALMSDATAVPLTLTLADKYGDYGLISVIILKTAQDALVIDEYLMSCRVLQRGVEQFAMNRIVELAKQKQLKFVRGSYLRTAKNDMVKDFYARFGFVKVETHESGDSNWLLTVDDYVPLEALINPITDEI